MNRPVSRLGVAALLGMALFWAEPRLTLSLARENDPAPRHLALTGEVMGKVAGIIIRWSAGRPTSLNSPLN